MLITDDQGLFRAGLTRLLANDGRLRMVGQSNEAIHGLDQTLEETLAHLPDVVLMDLQMPKIAGVDAVNRFNLESSSVHVLVVLAADFGKDTVGQAEESEIMGYLGKDVTPEAVVSRILARYVANTPVAQPHRSDLSRRELHVVAQVAAGLSNKQIAKLLGISQKTVRNHLSRIFNKLGAGNRTEAVMKAMRLGLLNA